MGWLFALPVTGAEPCAQVDPEMFFEESGPQAMLNIPIMRDMCASCPILNECRDHALRHEDHGFWGGMTYRERRVERKRLGISLKSVAVVNDRLFHQRQRDMKEREQYGLSLLPTRSDAKWNVAGTRSGKPSAA